MTLQPNQPLTDLVADAKASLKHHFGAEATLAAAAPGRVNLIGEHIDYCDGFVLPLAIERYIVVAAAPNGLNEVRLRSVDQPEATISLDEKITLGEPKWANYARGVIHGFQERGHTIPGFDACFVSSVPSGGGLSSSAALECAAATLLEGPFSALLSQLRKKHFSLKRRNMTSPASPAASWINFASAFGKKGSSHTHRLPKRRTRARPLHQS